MSGSTNVSFTVTTASTLVLPAILMGDSETNTSVSAGSTSWRNRSPRMTSGVDSTAGGGNPGSRVGSTVAVGDSVLGVDAGVMTGDTVSEAMVVGTPVGGIVVEDPSVGEVDAGVPTSSPQAITAPSKMAITITFTRVVNMERIIAGFKLLVEIPGGHLTEGSEFWSRHLAINLIASPPNPHLTNTTVRLLPN